MNTLYKNLRSLYNTKYNSPQSSNKKLVFKYSPLSFKICHILKREGFIQDFTPEKNTLNVALPTFMKIQSLRISKLTRPKYYKFKEIENSKEFYSNLGISVFSTSQGVFTYSDLLERKLGGVFLFQIL